MTSSADIQLNPSELDNFYTNYFRYYNTLSAAYKQRFIDRCLQFISKKEMYGAENFELDNRVKTLIAASAVQLTLGLETWELNYFDDIIVYSSSFDNSLGELKYNGETNLQGYIKLSWKSFIRGYEISNDTINLGLHEFTHALRFNGIKGNEQDYFIENYFNKWLSCACDAFNDIRNKKETIFRKYGGTNINEFLSVCIEHYFESPQEIKEHYPILYYATGILLNQEVSANATKIGVRKNLLEEQNKCLPGFTLLQTRSRFLKHWSSRLCGFVFAVCVYNILDGKLFNPITLGLLLMAIAIYVWYDFSATQIDFEGTQLRFKKGSLLFRNRKTWHVSASDLVSVRVGSEEWIMTYYNYSDDFFHEQIIHPPKDVTEIFISECKKNKIAILR
jgi:hypothetical protein